MHPRRTLIAIALVSTTLGACGTTKKDERGDDESPSGPSSKPATAAPATTSADKPAGGPRSACAPSTQSSAKSWLGVRKTKPSPVAGIRIPNGGKDESMGKLKMIGYWEERDVVACMMITLVEEDGWAVAKYAELSGGARTWELEKGPRHVGMIVGSPAGKTMPGNVSLIER